MGRRQATTVDIICNIRDAAPEVTDHGPRIALATRRVKSPEENDETDLVVWWTVLERLYRLGYDPEWMFKKHQPNENRVVTTYNNVTEFEDIKMAKTLDKSKTILEFENGEPSEEESE